jgi:hypothetical protein
MLIYAREKLTIGVHNFKHRGYGFCFFNITKQVLSDSDTQ